MTPHQFQALAFVLAWFSVGAVAGLIFFMSSELLRRALDSAKYDRPVVNLGGSTVRVLTENDIRKLLRSGQQDARPEAIEMAAIGGYSELLAELLEDFLRSGLSLEHLKVSESPVILAAMTNHPDCVRILLDAGADANSVHRCGDVAGSTLLCTCCLHNLTEVALDLLERGANPNLPHPDGTVTPLAAAACHGNLRLVDKLLGAGADVNATMSGHGVENATALWFATREGHEEVAKRLVRAGADLDARVRVRGAETTPRELARDPVPAHDEMTRAADS